MNKKTIAPIVATALLLVVAVLSVIYFQDWFLSYQSTLSNSLESVDMKRIDVNHIESDTLYVLNSGKDLEYSDVKVGGVSCAINGTISANQMNSILLDNCTLGMSKGPKEVVIVTKSGVFEKILMLRDGVSGSSSNEPSSPVAGAFSGYGYGENIGYVSFNGTGYQVLMNENQLYGNAYSENFGYISFNGSNYGVINVAGILDGYAYSENMGYISFNGTGYQTSFNGSSFLGYAYSENYGFIHFSSPLQYQVNYG